MIAPRQPSWRITASGGLRYDWQHSKFGGGCVPENVIRPDLLPSQCEEATQSGINPNTGQMEKIRPFGNWSPRLSVTYDMFGNGKTALKGSVSYYYKTRETLADNLSGLFTQTRLTYGANASSGLCSGSSCWTVPCPNMNQRPPNIFLTSMPKSLRDNVGAPSCADSHDTKLRFTS